MNAERSRETFRDFRLVHAGGVVQGDYVGSERDDIPGVPGGRCSDSSVPHRRGDEVGEADGDEGKAMIGSDFVWIVNPYTRRCGECHKKVEKGERIMASIKGGKVKKYVCSEDCRLEFDNEFWQGVIREKAKNLCAGGCGYPVAYAGDFCGECLCEEDGL
jgi:hypothetical protein